MALVLFYFGKFISLIALLPSLQSIRLWIIKLDLSMGNSFASSPSNCLPFPIFPPKVNPFRPIWPIPTAKWIGQCPRMSFCRWRWKLGPILLIGGITFLVPPSSSNPFHPILFQRRFSGELNWANVNWNEWEWEPICSFHQINSISSFASTLYSKCLKNFIKKSKKIYAYFIICHIKN